MLEPGDKVSIDIPARTIRVELSDEELAKRKAAWKPRPPRITHGALGKYAALATSADTGGILKWNT